MDGAVTSSFGPALDSPVLVGAVQRGATMLVDPMSVSIVGVVVSEGAIPVLINGLGLSVKGTLAGVVGAGAVGIGVASFAVVMFVFVENAVGGGFVLVGTLVSVGAVGGGISPLPEGVDALVWRGWLRTSLAPALKAPFRRYPRRWSVLRMADSPTWPSKSVWEIFW